MSILLITTNISQSFPVEPSHTNQSIIDKMLQKVNLQERGIAAQTIYMHTLMTNFIRKA